MVSSPPKVPLSLIRRGGLIIEEGLTDPKNLLNLGRIFAD